jgi:hypothetical protein
MTAVGLAPAMVTAPVVEIRIWGFGRGRWIGGGGAVRRRAVPEGERGVQRGGVWWGRRLDT